MASALCVYAARIETPAHRDGLPRTTPLGEMTSFAAPSRPAEGTRVSGPPDSEDGRPSPRVIRSLDTIHVLFGFFQCVSTTMGAAAPPRTPSPHESRRIRSSAVATPLVRAADSPVSDAAPLVRESAGSGASDNVSVERHLSVPEPTGVLLLASAGVVLAVMVKKRRSTAGSA